MTVAQDAPDQERFDSGNIETTEGATVTDQASTEVDLDMPLNAQQSAQDRQQPRSGDGGGSVGDTANEADTGQSATSAPKKGE